MEIEEIIKREALNLKKIDDLWSYYHSHGISNYEIAKEINNFNEQYSKLNGGMIKHNYFNELKLYLYKKFIKKE